MNDLIQPGMKLEEIAHILYELEKQQHEQG
jgi:hypothetical protein